MVFASALHIPVADLLRACTPRQIRACCSRASFAEFRRATAPNCVSTWMPSSSRASRGMRSPRRARVVWRDAPVAPRTGERWRLLVRLAPLADAHNFSGPDTARFAFRDGVHFAGRVLPSALNARLALANTSIDTLRARVAARIGESVADPDAAALLTALAVGLTDRHERRPVARVQCHRNHAPGRHFRSARHDVRAPGVHGGALRMALAAFRAARRPRAIRIVVRPRRRGRLRAARPGSRCRRSAPG